MVQSKKTRPVHEGYAFPFNPQNWPHDAANDMKRFSNQTRAQRTVRKKYDWSAMVHYIYENLQDRSANHRPLMAKHKFDIFPEMSTDLYTHVLTLLIFSPIFPATKQNITQEEALQVSLTLLKVLPISLLKSNHSLLPQIQSLPSNNPNTQTQCPCSYPEHSSSCTQN